MLDLHDPLWAKLEDGQGGGDIADRLIRLSKIWDDEAAASLFGDCLCHQETCYSATYAAIPHLLTIAKREENVEQRREIALFLGFVTLCTFDHQSDVRSVPDRTPDGRAARTLLPMRSLQKSEPDIANRIRMEFFEALPEVGDLCRQAFVECLEDEHAPRYLLSGMAAAAACEIDLARHLESGFEGTCKCSACGWVYDYLFFGDQAAIYASPVDRTLPLGQRQLEEEPLLLDYREGAPSRADGFVTPLDESEAEENREIAAMLDLTRRTSMPELKNLLLTVLGSFVCGKCGAEGPLKRI